VNAIRNFVFIIILPIYLNGNGKLSKFRLELEMGRKETREKSLEIFHCTQNDMSEIRDKETDMKWKMQMRSRFYLLFILVLL
jgi:hypothetical protein